MGQKGRTVGKGSPVVWGEDSLREGDLGGGLQPGKTWTSCHAGLSSSHLDPKVEISSLG